jgi:hypothetical protein
VGRAPARDRCLYDSSPITADREIHSRRAKRIAENELVFRQLNDRFEEVRIEATRDRAADAVMAAVCECGDAQCFAPIELPLVEYDRIRRDRQGDRRFIVKPGHEIPEVETVVETQTDYSVVEKPEGAIRRGDG